jgi:hypothetical protein
LWEELCERVTEVAQASPMPGLSLLTAGSPTTSVSRPLPASGAARSSAPCGNSIDFVIIDSAPVLLVADARSSAGTPTAWSSRCSAT